MIKRAALSATAILLSIVIAAGCGSRPAAENRQAATGPAPAGQTSQVNQPLTGLSWIKMIDSRSGWAVDRDAVLRTADGGATWQDVTPLHIQALFNYNLPYGVFFLDAGTGWVAGYDQGALTLWRTQDGGRNWGSARVQDNFSVQGMSGDRFNLTCLGFSGRNNGWMLLSAGLAMGSELVAILTTVDGGISWQAVGVAAPGQDAPGSLPFGGRKNGLSFVDSGHGWITGSWHGDGFWLFRTADGGKTWYEQDLPAVKGLSTEGGAVETKPPFFSGNGGVLPVVFRGGGQTLVFYRTDDRGLTWKATAPLQTSPDQSAVWSILDVERFFVTDGTRIYTTGDGGLTWKTVQPQSKLGQVRQIDLLDDSAGWMLGDGFELQTKDGGQTWTAMEAVKLP